MREKVSSRRKRISPILYQLVCKSKGVIGHTSSALWGMGENAAWHHYNAEITRRTTNPRLQVMSVMKHHTTSEDVLILRPLGWQDQLQSNTPSIKRSLGAQLERVC